MSNLLVLHRDEIQQICQKSGINYLAVFGSQVRDEARADSDVDLLVEFRITPGLIEFIRIKQLFEDVLKRKVDLVTKKGLSKHIEPYIKKDIMQIYG